MVDPGHANTGTLLDGLQFGSLTLRPGLGAPIGRPTPTGQGIASNRANESRPNTTNYAGLDFFTDARIRMSITSDGKIGIGTPAPSRALEIDGSGDTELGLKSADTDRLWTVQSSGNNAANPALAGTFQIIDRSAAPPGTIGKSRCRIDQNGTVALQTLKIEGGADVAEPFVMSTDDVRKGPVVVIDENRPGQLTLSTHAYDTRLAGIVSGAGGIDPGISLRSQDAATAENVALSGRVYAFADR